MMVGRAIPASGSSTLGEGEGERRGLGVGEGERLGEGLGEDEGLGLGESVGDGDGLVSAAWILKFKVHA